MIKKDSAKIKYLIVAFIINVLLCAACGKTASGDDNKAFKVYFISEGSSIAYKEYTIDEMLPEEMVNRLLTIMSLSSEDGLVAPFSYGSKVLDTHIENDTAYVNMDGDYLELDKADEILVRASIVKTITQVPGVSKVAIMVSGNNYFEPMTEAGFLIGDEESIMPKENMEITYYLKNSSRDGLVAVTKTIEYSQNMSKEMAIINELIKGANKDLIKNSNSDVKNVKSVINKNTVLNTINKENGICYVDFSKEFLKLESGVSEEMAVYSVVNTLTELDDIDGVIITIESGNSDNGFMSRYTEVLYKNKNIVLTY